MLFLKRPGGQSQFSAQLAGQLAEREPLRELQAWIAEHPEAPTLGRGARAPRRHEPAQLRARLRARGRHDARRASSRRRASRRRAARLEEGDDGVDARRARCGFGSAETLRRAFLRVLRVGPAAYRSRFRRARVSLNPEREETPMGITTGILLFDDAEELDFVGPWEVFTMARHGARRATAS